MALRIDSNDELTTGGQYHVVPGTLSGPALDNAGVTGYFGSSITADQGQLRATLQGNLLKGTAHEVSQMFKGVACRGDDGEEIVVTHKVGTITDWRKDAAWGEWEGPVGTLRKYVALQTALHS